MGRRTESTVMTASEGRWFDGSAGPARQTEKSFALARADYINKLEAEVAALRELLHVYDKALTEAGVMKSSLPASRLPT